jgi:uncharacterized protein (DUF302 family)
MAHEADTNSGIVRIRANQPVAATVDRLEALLKDRGITVFARINFSEDAAKAGLAMRPEQLLIFGNPKAGTPLMQAVPLAGLDLPLKALIWEDASGDTWIAYNQPEYIIQRHGLAASAGANLGAVIPILERAARG